MKIKRKVNPNRLCRPLWNFYCRPQLLYLYLQLLTPNRFKYRNIKVCLKTKYFMVHKQNNTFYLVNLTEGAWIWKTWERTRWLLWGYIKIDFRVDIKIRFNTVLVKHVLYIVWNERTFNNPIFLHKFAQTHD